MTPDSKQFHRGRFARSQGKPRVIKDGRMSPQTRAHWFAGWDEEDSRRQPPPTPEQEAEANEALKIAHDFLVANGYRQPDR